MVYDFDQFGDFVDYETLDIFTKYFESDDATPTAHVAGGVDFSLETACCKVFGSEMVNRAANEALQIAGGIGYSKEFPYEQFVRDARMNMLFEGTNEVLRALVALMGLQEAGEQIQALGKAFKDPLHSIGVIATYVAGRAKRQVVKPKLPICRATISCSVTAPTRIAQSTPSATRSACRLPTPSSTSTSGYWR